MKNYNGHEWAWEFILESREVVKNATNVFVRSFAMGKTSNRSQNRSLVAEIESFECWLLAEDTTSYSFWKRDIFAPSCTLLIYFFVTCHWNFSYFFYIICQGADIADQLEIVAHVHACVGARCPGEKMTRKTQNIIKKLKIPKTFK